MIKIFIQTLWQVFYYPRRTFNRLASQTSVAMAAVFVSGFGAINAIFFLISYLRKDWPPPSEELSVWIEAWGEFSQLPFLKIPAEQYRLFQAIILIPLVLVMWILMAGTARLLGIVFHGKVSFDQYLNLTAFSYFPFWLIAMIFDTSYNILLDTRIVPALQGVYGEGMRAVFLYSEPMAYVIMFGLSGVYSAIAVHTAEHLSGSKYSYGQSALVGFLIFGIAMVFASTLLR